jgi:nucleoside-diphosphate-sugar epimerase
MDGVCAVTGSGGYLGSVVVARLKEAGFHVLELSRRSSSPYHLEMTDPEPLFRDRKIDVLIHCAYDFNARSREEIRRINVEGSRRLFEAAGRAGVGRIIFISTMSSFPGCRSSYGQAKFEIEAAARAVGADIVRPGLIYGKDPKGMVGTLVRLVRASPIVPLIGNGNQVLYTIHEDDLADWIARRAGTPNPELPFPMTAAHPSGRSFREILTHFAKKNRRSFWLVPIPWRLIWLALKSFEVLGFRLPMRSDSVVSLMHQDPSPDFRAFPPVPLHARSLE